MLTCSENEVSDIFNVFISFVNTLIGDRLDRLALRILLNGEISSSFVFGGCTQSSDLFSQLNRQSDFFLSCFFVPSVVVDNSVVARQLSPDESSLHTPDNELDVTLSPHVTYLAFDGVEDVSSISASNGCNKDYKPLIGESGNEL